MSTTSQPPQQLQQLQLQQMKESQINNPPIKNIVDEEEIQNVNTNSVISLITIKNINENKMDLYKKLEWLCNSVKYLSNKYKVSNKLNNKPNNKLKEIKNTNYFFDQQCTKQGSKKITY